LEDETPGQIYHLAPGNLKQLLIQKKSWPGLRPIQVETVEISPTLCCFEWEGEQVFGIGDELDFYFYLEESSLSINAAIRDVDRCEFLGEGYEHKTSFTYCAQFAGALDKDFFKRIVGSPRKCKSLYKVKWERERKSNSPHFKQKTMVP
jgi:hypothetical protein